MDILNCLLGTIYFYLPGALANMGAVLAKFVPGFREIRMPIDFGRSWRGKRLIGDHKNWGGFLMGVSLGTTMGAVKVLFLDDWFEGWQLARYGVLMGFIMYIVMSVGAVSGDLIKSIIKRQLGVVPHAAWVPFDEIDHSSVAMFLVVMFFGVSLNLAVAVVLVYFLIHVMANWVGFWWGLKKVPY